MSHDKSLKINITKAAREYGYIIWSKKYDVSMNELLQANKRIKIKVNNMISEKNIDWKKRRISIGYTTTRAIDKKYTNYILRKLSDDTLEINWS